MISPLQSFTVILDQALDVLDVKDEARRKSMADDVVVYFITTALNGIVEKHLSEDGKKRLDDVLKFDSAPDQRTLEMKWHEAMKIIDEEVAGKEISDEIEEILKKALVDYMQAITANATDEQRQRLAELFEKRA